MTSAVGVLYGLSVSFVLTGCRPCVWATSRRWKQRKATQLHDASYLCNPRGHSVGSEGISLVSFSEWTRQNFVRTKPSLTKGIALCSVHCWCIPRTTKPPVAATPQTHTSLMRSGKFLVTLSVIELSLPFAISTSK